MKLSAFLLLFPFLAAVLPLRAQLTWTTTHQEFTPAPDAQTVVAEYPFVNRTAATIHVLDVISSCGCTVPELAKKVYAPGETGTLKATFTIGSRQGLQTKLITVRTDAGDAALQLIAHLPERLEIDPRLVIFRAADAAPRTLKLIFRTDGPVTGVTVSDPGPAFTAHLTEDQPGVAYTVTVAPTAQATGDVRATLIIRSKGASGIDYVDSAFLRREP